MSYDNPLIGEDGEPLEPGDPRLMGQLLAANVRAPVTMPTSGLDQPAPFDMSLINNARPAPAPTPNMSRPGDQPQGPVLKRAIQGAQPYSPDMTQAPAQAQAQPADGGAAEYRRRSLALLEQAGAQGPTDEEKQAMIEHARQREEGSNRKLMLALTLGSKGGESFKPFASLMGQQAMKESEPLKVEGGYVTSDGLVMDPGFESKRRQQQLETQAKIYESMAQHAETVQQRNLALKAADDTKRELAYMQDQTRHEIAAARGSGGGAGGKLHLQRAGTTPSGELVSYDPGSGQQLVNGQPYNGPVMSQATLDKQATMVQESLSAINRMKALDTLVAANPNAFGGVATLSALTPQIFSSRIQNAKLTPAERETRARVLQESANVIHDLYGAALTAGEERRASAFAFNPTDPPEAILIKLKAALAWANSKASMYGGGVRGAAEARNGGGASGPPAGAVREKQR